MDSKAGFVGFAGIVLVVFAACSSSREQLSDPCTPDRSVRCSNNATGVACADGYAPSSDSSTQCAAGSGANNFCCASAESCASSVSVSCPAGAQGYSCNGGASPDDVYVFDSLFCDVPAGGGNYCCFSAVATVGVTCSPDHGAAGCPTSSYGFACTGTDSPARDFAHLTCGAGVAPTNAAAGTALANATLFCCTYE